MVWMPQRFYVNCANLAEGIKETYDMVAANILSRVILDLLNEIEGVLKAGGIFICSGITDKNETQVVTAMRNIGFEILEISFTRRVGGHCRKVKGIGHGA